MRALDQDLGLGECIAGVGPRSTSRTSAATCSDFNFGFAPAPLRDFRPSGPLALNRSRKQKRTIKQPYVDLVALGHEVAYGRVAAFARDWWADRQREQLNSGRETFVPLAFQPGEAVAPLYP